ncbi:peptide ABC transporter substrate-binding protein [Candidatus Bipolaricaulota bacterium]|nr:peptide ABC transporter substrate-binding protein [Candidatus Bipolaricaulota bacterium]
MRNRIAVACLGIFLTVGLAALGSPALNSLVIGATQEPSNLSPWEGSADTKENLMGIFNIGLTYFDSEGVLQPGLATEIPRENNGSLVIVKDADGKVVRQQVLWTIRDDAFWSDGVPITSDDAIFTFKVQNTEEMLVVTRAFSNLIEEVTKVDDKSFLIIYKTPNLFYANVGGSIGLARHYDIAPKHIWEPIYDAVMTQIAATPENASEIIQGQFLGAPASTGTGTVVGSGAFAFVEWQINQFMRFARRADFFLDPPGPVANYLQEITVRYIVAQPTLLSGIIAGEIEASDDIGLAGLDPTILRAQLGNQGIVDVTPSGFIEKLNFNLFPDYSVSNDLLLGDKRTRQAIIQAIDREDLARTVYPGATVSNSFLVAGDIGYDETLNQWPYDPAAASALFAELGWADSDDNGILDRTVDGRLIEFRLHWVATTADFRIRTGEVLLEMLADVGIKLEVENLPGSVVFSSAYLNHGSEGTWRGIVEYAEGGGIGQAPADPLSNELWANDLLEIPVDDVLENTPLPENSFGGTNITGWVNAEFDQLRADALQEFDLAKRSAIVVLMQQLYNEELPTVPLYDRSEVVVKMTGLVNYVKGTAAARTQFWNAWEWGWEQNGAVAVR